MKELSSWPQIFPRIYPSSSSKHFVSSLLPPHTSQHRPVCYQDTNLFGIDITPILTPLSMSLMFLSKHYEVLEKLNS